MGSVSPINGRTVGGNVGYFGDRDEVRRVYARELAELIAAATGAARAVGFPFANKRYSPRYAGTETT
jgi:hypothetical protein